MVSNPPIKNIIDEVIHTELEDGRQICIRSIRPTDEEKMRKGIAQLSTQSLYLRFFSGQSKLPDQVIKKLIDVDGHHHIAWGAIHNTGHENPAIGAVHAVRNEEQTHSGEFSVAIIDAFHGLGLARMLTAVLLINCRLEGITMLDVQILSVNRAATSLIQSLGGEYCKTEYGVADHRLETDVALDILHSKMETKGLKDVFSTLHKYL